MPWHSIATGRPSQVAPPTSKWTAENVPVGRFCSRSVTGSPALTAAGAAVKPNDGSATMNEYEAVALSPAADATSVTV